MEKALVGTPSAMVRVARGAMLVGLAGMGLLLGATLFSPPAQARPLTVCCFRVTVEVSGEAHGVYTRVDPTDSQGLYAYLWDGTAYALAHLQGSTLRTDRGVAAGYLQENNGVTDSSGRPRDRNDPGCSQGPPVTSARGLLGKTRYSFPQIGLGNGGLAFGRPFEHWELNCGSLATETLFDLQAGNRAWRAPREFFFHTNIRGLSARRLASGHSQQVTCVEKSSRRSDPRMHSFGFSAVSIKIVPFPATDLGHQQHRLAGFLGKPINWGRRPVAKLIDDFFASRHTPGNGCHKGG